MTTKRFKFVCDDENCFFKDNEKVLYCYEVVELLNELHEETQKQKTTIRMLEQQSQRQINRNDRLHKDWDKLYQHLLDMGLMTDEEILKVLIE